MRLLEFRNDVFSQNGEDGVIAELLQRLGIDSSGDRWCVEFGAWNGKHLSNTFHLVKSADWNAIYIEGDPTKYTELERTAREYSRVRPIKAMVTGESGSGSTLDELLIGTELPTDYDLLSIDIDSSDLDVWAHHRDFRPKVVVIEINSSIPPGVLQWHSSARQFGSSFSSTLNVAHKKGYTLVCHTGNLILVRNEMVDAVGLPDIDREFPERLFIWDWVNRRSSFKGRMVDFAFGMGRRLPTPAKDAIQNTFFVDESNG